MHLERVFFSHLLATTYRSGSTNWTHSYRAVVDQIVGMVLVEVGEPRPRLQVERIAHELFRVALDGYFPTNPGSVMHIVSDGHCGPLVRIPRPSCMERHLPKDRPPTPAEFEIAWDSCSHGRD